MQEKKKNAELKINISKAEVQKFLESFNSNFYAVGSLWGDQDQAERFYEEKIWEKGQGDDSYSTLINQVKKGDIVILKSTFVTGEGKNYLGLKESVLYWNL
jgi:hypothetical protein